MVAREVSRGVAFSFFENQNNNNQKRMVEVNCLKWLQCAQRLKNNVIQSISAGFERSETQMETLTGQKSC